MIEKDFHEIFEWYFKRIRNKTRNPLKICSRGWRVNAEAPINRWESNFDVYADLIGKII